MNMPDQEELHTRITDTSQSDNPESWGPYALVPVQEISPKKNENK